MSAQETPKDVGRRKKPGRFCFYDLALSCLIIVAFRKILASLQPLHSGQDWFRWLSLSIYRNNCR